MASLHSKLEEQLMCPICLEQLKSPKALPCLHSFCHDCLVKIINNNKLICPECRKSVEIENPPDLSFLPSNFVVNNILETIANGSVESTHECCGGNCDNDMVVEYQCSECCLHLCHLCSESHIFSEETRNHHITPLDEVDTSKVLPSNNGDPTVCSKHHEKLGIFCTMCQIAICDVCVSEIHQEHLCQPVDKIAGKEKSKINQLLEEMKKKREFLSGQLASAKKSEENLLAKKEIVIPEIINFFEELSQMIAKRRDELVEQATTLFETRQKEPIENLELAVSKCDNVIRNAEEKFAGGSDAEVLNQKAIIQGCLQCLGNKASVSTADEKQPTIKFVTGYTTKEINEKFLKRCFVLGDVASPEMCTVAFKYPKDGLLLVERPSAITVVCKDKCNENMSSGGQLIAPIFTGVKVEDVSVIDNNNGCYDTLFTAKEIGVMNFQALINGYPAHRCSLSAKVTWTMRENIGNGILSDSGLTLTSDRAFGNLCYRVGGYCFTTGIYGWKVQIKYTGGHSAFSFKREIEVGVIDGDGDLSFEAIKNHHTSRWVGKCRAEVVANVRLDMDSHVLSVQFSGGTNEENRSIAPAQYRFDIKARRVCPYFALQGKHSNLTVSPNSKTPGH